MPYSSWTPPELLKVSSDFWLSSALHAGVKLDIFTPLSESPHAAPDLAHKLELSERGLTMLLDALVSLRLLEKDESNYRASSFSAEFLSSNSSKYLGHIIRHHHHLMGSWFQLDEAVRSGEPVRNRISHEGEEIERESFLMGMFNLAMLTAPTIVNQIDFSGHSHLLDLGGGPGTYAIQFCWKNPALRATIVDLPSTQKLAEKNITNFDLHDRVNFVAGDFHDGTLSGSYDVAWLSHVLHAEGEQGCAKMLKKTVNALEPGGLLLIQDFILDDNRSQPLFPALFSLNMLVGTPQGKSYSEGEIKDMLNAAGCEQVERLPIDLPNGAGIIKGYKA